MLVGVQHKAVKACKVEVARQAGLARMVVQPHRVWALLLLAGPDQR